MSLQKKQKEKIIHEFAQSKEDTGSPEVQVALLTQRIVELSGHLKVHPKDFHSRRGLLKLVASRRSLLDYVKKQNVSRYEELIRRLDLRK